MYMEQEVDDAQHIAEMMAVQQIAQNVIGVTCSARQTHGLGLRDRALHCLSFLCATCQSLPGTCSSVGKEDVLSEEWQQLELFPLGAGAIGGDAAGA